MIIYLPHKRCIAAETASIIAAGIGAAASGASTAVGAKTNRRGAKLARELNEKNQQFAREQNQWNLDLYHEDQAYNSIESQLARWKAAGLNPNMFAPEGFQTSVPASADLANAAPSGQESAGVPLIQQGVSQLADAGMSYLRAKQIQKETDKVTAEIPKIKADTDLIKAQTHCTEEQAKTYAVQIDQMNATIRELNSVTELNSAQTRKTNQDIFISAQDLNLRIRQTEAQIKKTFSDIGVNDANIKKIAKEMVLLAYQAVKTKAEITTVKLNNGYQNIINKYVDKKESLELDKIGAEIYGQLTSSVQKSVEGFTTGIINGFQNIFGSKNKGPLQYNLMDRVNNKFGVSNQW